MQCKITFAVAIYNVDAYLEECIKSISMQKCDDMEILLINDASPDNSLEICEKYAKNDSRIRIISFESNRGVCAVRNTAINEAKGKWLIFSDGDDIVSCNAVNFALKLYECDEDIIFFGVEEFSDRCINLPSEKEPEMVEIPRNDIVKMSKACITFNADKSLFKTYNGIRMASSWAKMYNVEFLKKYKLMFPENQQKSEDTIFNSTALFYCRKAMFVPDIIYFYRINQSSVCRRYNSNIVSVINSFFKYCYKYIDNFFPEDDTVKQDFYTYRVINEIFICLNLYFLHKDNPKKIKELEDEFFQFMSTQPFKKALEECDMKKQWFIRRPVIKAIQKKNFVAVRFLSANGWLLKLYAIYKSVCRHLTGVGEHN